MRKRIVVSSLLAILMTGCVTKRVEPDALARSGAPPVPSPALVGASAGSAAPPAASPASAAPPAASPASAAPPAASSSSDWEAYQKLNEPYYFVSDQPVERVACRVSISTLDPDKLREQLQPAAYFQIDENVRDFQVIYQRTRGVAFVVPHFSATLVSTEGIQDVEAARRGLSMVNQGVKDQIDGTKTTVNSVLLAFIRPSKEALSGLRVTTDGAGKTVQYRSQGVAIEQRFAGGTRTTRYSLMGAATEEVDEFAPVGGKLALARSVAHVSQPDGAVDLVMVYRYQDLGRLSYPLALEVDYASTTTQLRQEAHMIIGFTQCQVE